MDELLTEEQKVKFKALKKDIFFRMLKINLKFVATLVAANFVIAIVNAQFVQNPAFSFTCTVITSFMCLRSFLANANKEHDRIKEEIQKILA